MSYSFADSLRAGSEWNWFGSAAAEPNQIRPDPVHLVGFIRRIYHDARLPERQI